MSADDKSVLSDNMLFAAYAAAVLIPIVGFAMAIYCFCKNRPGHGMGVMAVAVTSWCFWMALGGFSL